MLRITSPAEHGSGAYLLEGRLTGVWADELLRVAGQSDVGPDTVFDIEDVFYADAQGEQALAQIGQTGARFLAQSAYGKHLCERLQLNRIEAYQDRPPRAVLKTPRNAA